MSETVSAKEAAAMLGVHPNTILNWVRNGTLRGFKKGLAISSETRIYLRSIHEFDRKRQIKPQK